MRHYDLTDRITMLVSAYAIPNADATPRTLNTIGCSVPTL